MAPLAALAWKAATMLCADCTAVASCSRRDSMISERSCSSVVMAMNSSATSAVPSMGSTFILKPSLFIVSLRGASKAVATLGGFGGDMPEVCEDVLICNNK